MKCNRNEEEESVGTRLHALTGKGVGRKGRKFFQIFLHYHNLWHNSQNPKQGEDKRPKPHGNRVMK
jgi:hypothetical protein